MRIKNTRDSREREKRIRTGHYKRGQQKKSDKTDAVLTAYSNNSHDNNRSTFMCVAGGIESKRREREKIYKDQRESP